MSRSEHVPGLRVDIPAREPDPVLLTQLTQLSSAQPSRGRRALPRIVLATASVVAVASVSWVAGAVPGTRSPLEPAHRPSRPVAPAPTTQAPTPTAPAPAPTPGASGSPTAGRSWPGGRASGSASPSSRASSATPSGTPSDTPSATPSTGLPSASTSLTAPAEPSPMSSGAAGNRGLHNGEGHPRRTHPPHPSTSAGSLLLPSPTDGKEQMHRQ